MYSGDLTQRLGFGQIGDTARCAKPSSALKYIRLPADRLARRFRLRRGMLLRQLSL